MKPKIPPKANPPLGNEGLALLKVVLSASFLATFLLMDLKKQKKNMIDLNRRRGRRGHPNLQGRSPAMARSGPYGFPIPLAKRPLLRPRGASVYGPLYHHDHPRNPLRGPTVHRNRRQGRGLCGTPTTSPSFASMIRPRETTKNGAFPGTTRSRHRGGQHCGHGHLIYQKRDIGSQLPRSRRLELYQGHVG